MKYGFPEAPVVDWYGVETLRVVMSTARHGGRIRRQVKLLLDVLEAKAGPEEIGCLQVMQSNPALCA